MGKLMVGLARILLLCAVVLPTMMLCDTAFAAVTLVFDDFSDTTGLTGNGTAVTTTTSDGTILRLAHSQYWQGGSIFSDTQVGVTAFSTSFTFRISNRGGELFDCNSTAGADGLVFVIQPVSSSSLGGGGGSIGYEGIPNSVGIEFDTWCNSALNDPSSNHVGIVTDGSVNHATGASFTADVTPDFDDGNLWYAWIDYNGSVLEVRVNQTGIRPTDPLLTQTLDIPTLISSSTAFVGFTSATGLAFGDHDIIRWQFAAGPPPGWYSPGFPVGGAALMHDDISGLRIVWANSYIYQHPGTDNLYWYAQVLYINDGSQILQINCSEQADQSLFKEHIRGTEELPPGTSVIVAAEETFCSRNPSTIISIGPGETFYDWAIFRNVPSEGEVSLEWGKYGSSPWVNPWYRPYPSDVPPPAECPPELVTLGTCQPGPRPIMATHLSTEPDGKAPHLIVLVHGCCTDANGVKEWDDLGRLIAGAIIRNQTPGPWEIVVWDWTKCTSDPNVECTPKPPIWDLPNFISQANIAHTHALFEGGELANIINQYPIYEYIHLIAHSAGAKLIDEAAFQIALNNTDQPFLHITFLDAYTRDDNDKINYGGLPIDYPHYVEHYVDKSPLDVADACLASAFNFDVAKWSHFPWEGGLLPGHQWPVNWYKKSITSTSPQFKYGYPLSLEGSGKNIDELVNELAQYPAGQQCGLDTGLFNENPNPDCQPAACWE
jgi:hypothetical protein